MTTGVGEREHDAPKALHAISPRRGITIDTYARGRMPRSESLSLSSGILIWATTSMRSDTHPLAGRLRFGACRRGVLGARTRSRLCHRPPAFLAVRPRV